MRLQANVQVHALSPCCQRHPINDCRMRVCSCHRCVLHGWPGPSRAAAPHPPQHRPAIDAQQSGLRPLEQQHSLHAQLRVCTSRRTCGRRPTSSALGSPCRRVIMLRPPGARATEFEAGVERGRDSDSSRSQRALRSSDVNLVQCLRVDIFEALQASPARLHVIDQT